MSSLYDRKQSFVPAEATLREHVLFFYAHSQDLAAKLGVSTEDPGWGNMLMTRIEQTVDMLDEHSEAILQPEPPEPIVLNSADVSLRDAVFSAVGLKPADAGTITRRIGEMYPGIWLTSTSKNPRAMVGTYLTEMAGKKCKWIERVDKGMYRYNPETSEAPAPPVFVQRGKP